MYVFIKFELQRGSFEIKFEYYQSEKIEDFIKLLSRGGEGPNANEPSLIRTNSTQYQSDWKVENKFIVKNFELSHGSLEVKFEHFESEKSEDFIKFLNQLLIDRR